MKKNRLSLGAAVFGRGCFLPPREKGKKNGTPRDSFHWKKVEDQLVSLGHKRGEGKEVR